MSQALVFVAVLLLAAKVSCFPNGAPAPACLTLSPNPANHGAQPMPLPIPFVLANFTEAFYINGSLAYEPGQTYRCKSHCTSYVTPHGLDSSNLQTIE